MSLRLDPRQRAMLAEMGLPVFFPDTPDEPVSAAVTLDETIRVAVASDGAFATAAAGPRANAGPDRGMTFSGVGDVRPDWLLVGDASDDEGGLQGEPFTGDAGRLLDNMLKAMGVARGRKVYLAHVTKQAVGDPLLARRVQELQPKVILAMGRFAVQALAGTDEPLGRLRGRALDYLGFPLVVTYAPAYLLRNLPEKAKAWADLCLAQSLMAGRAS